MGDAFVHGANKVHGVEAGQGHDSHENDCEQRLINHAGQKTAAQPGRHWRQGAIWREGLAQSLIILEPFTSLFSRNRGRPGPGLVEGPDGIFRARRALFKDDGEQCTRFSLETACGLSINRRASRRRNTCPTDIQFFTAQLFGRTNAGVPENSAALRSRPVPRGRWWKWKGRSRQS